MYANDQKKNRQIAKNRKQNKSFLNRSFRVMFV